LIRHTAEADRQKATKASPTFSSTVTRIRSALASGAAKTSTFFSHCRCRAALTKPLAEERGRRSDGAAAEVVVIIISSDRSVPVAP
jgi:hypothetical protein